MKLKKQIYWIFQHFNLTFTQFHFNYPLKLMEMLRFIWIFFEVSPRFEVCTNNKRKHSSLKVELNLRRIDQVQ
jgi:hypothetical protein